MDELEIFSFYAIDENGEMRHTATYHITEGERAEVFPRYREDIMNTYPGNTAGWRRGDSGAEITELRQKIDDLQSEVQSLQEELHES